MMHFDYIRTVRRGPDIGPFATYDEAVLYRKLYLKGYGEIYSRPVTHVRERGPDLSGPVHVTLEGEQKSFNQAWDAVVRNGLGPFRYSGLQYGPFLPSLYKGKPDWTPSCSVSFVTYFKIAAFLVDFSSSVHHLRVVVRPA